MTAPDVNRVEGRMMAANLSPQCVGHNGHAYVHEEIFYYGSVCERYGCTPTDPSDPATIAFIEQKQKEREV